MDLLSLHEAYTESRIATIGAQLGWHPEAIPAIQKRLRAHSRALGAGVHCFTFSITLHCGILCCSRLFERAWPQNIGPALWPPCRLAVETTHTHPPLSLQLLDPWIVRSHSGIAIGVIAVAWHGLWVRDCLFAEHFGG